MWPVPLDWPHGDIGLAALARPTPGRLWPSIPMKLRVALAIALGRLQPLPQPAGDRHAHGIPNELPPIPVSTTVGRRLVGDGPFDRKALESFGVADVWSHQLRGARRPNCGGGGGAETRPALQSWHRIDGPAESA